MVLPFMSMFFMSYAFYAIDQEYDKLGTKYLSHLTDEELLACYDKRMQQPPTDALPIS